MSRCIVAVLIGCALLVASCSSNSSTPMLAGSHAAKSAFSVQTEPGSSFNTRLELNTEGADTTVAIWAEDADAITEAYLHLNYDVTAYTPVEVEIGEFLGDPGNVLNLAITDIAGEVPIGMCQLKTTAVPVSGNGLLATVTFKNEPNTSARSTSQAPSGSVNQVTDLYATPNGATSANLRWTEVNNGDYDNNSIVAITDLQPLANFIFQKVNETSDPVWAGVMDGDHNGEINTADIASIAANFGTSLQGYQIYLDSAGTTPVDGSTPCNCSRPLDVNPKIPVEYDVDVTFTEGSTPMFTVRPISNDGSNEAGTLSNTAEVLIITDPPDAPTNLLALSGQDYGGAGAIRLSWDAPDSPHLRHYEIQRKFSIADDSAWTNVYELSATSTTWTDTGLDDASYDYRVYAWNLGDLRSEDPTNTATNTPWFLPPPSPPTNVTAVPGSVDSSIDITWTAPSDGSAEGYYVYRKAQNDTNFTMIDSIWSASTTNYSDYGLNEGETYEYYVASTQINDSIVQESDPSNTASSLPKESEDITITSLTTDKTTHCADGSDGTASTFTVTATPEPTTVDWVCTLGSVTGTGTTVTWDVPTSATPQVVTITCTVHKGSNVDSGEIKLYLTEETIKTTKGISGKYVNFDNCPSNLQPNNPYKPFSDFFDERNVVLLSKFGVW